jgi:hypothetical protein
VRRQQGHPELITEAAVSYQEQHRARRRKYAIMMSLRSPLLIAAAAASQWWWLSLTLILLSIPLPWMAVLIANDRPPRKKERVNRFRPDTTAKAIEVKEHQVIEVIDMPPVEPGRS